MKTSRLPGLALALLVVVASPIAVAKKKAAAAPVEASAETQRAIGELAGKFKWGINHEEAMKIISDDMKVKFDEKMKKENNAFRQDAMRKEFNEALEKVQHSYAKFDGQKTGWDVSLIDHEFAHNNDESMFIIWEKDQRRFLFFKDDKLWKQFIAFNSEHPAFQGKTFDDFADLIQKRYGPAAMTFRKMRTSDEQTFDHLEWPPAGDFILWAIDETGFYGNYCLSLMQKSVLPEVMAQRKAGATHNAPAGSALVDSVTKPSDSKHDANADIVDEITGHGKKAASDEEEKKAEDPLKGSKF